MRPATPEELANLPPVPLLGKVREEAAAEMRERCLMVCDMGRRALALRRMMGDHGPHDMILGIENEIRALPLVPEVE